MQVEYAAGPASQLFVGMGTRPSGSDAPVLFALGVNGSVLNMGDNRAVPRGEVLPPIPSGSLVTFVLDLPAAVVRVEVDGALTCRGGGSGVFGHSAGWGRWELGRAWWCWCLCGVSCRRRDGGERSPC